MKITNFTSGSLPEAVGAWSSGVFSLNSNATTTDGGLSAINFVQRITANGSNVLLNPSVNFAAGSNITLSASSNTITVTGSAVAGGGGGTPAGTSFPGSPSTNDQFFRTDLGLVYYYDGTRWLSMQLVNLPLGLINTSGSLPTANTITDFLRVGVPSLEGSSDFWIVSHTVDYRITPGGSALSASHKWVCNFRKFRANTSVTLSTPSIASGPDSTYLQIVTAIGALLNAGSDYEAFVSTWTKTGTPGSLNVQEIVTLRYVG